MTEQPIPFTPRPRTAPKAPEPPTYPYTLEALEVYDQREARRLEATTHDTRPGAARRAEHRDALARFEVREAFCRDTRIHPDRRTRREIAGMSIDEIRAIVTRGQEAE